MSAGSRSRARLGDALVALGGLLAVAAVARAASTSFPDLPAALAFGATIVAGEVLRVRLPVGREVAPVSLAAGLGCAARVLPHPHAGLDLVLPVLAVVAVAQVVGGTIHGLLGREVDAPGLGLRLVSVGIGAGTLHLLTPVWPAQDHSGLGLLAVGATVGALVAAAVGGALDAEQLGGRALTAVRDALRAQLGLVAALATTAVLMAFAGRELGLLVLPVFAAPLAVTQYSIRRFAAIRTTYLQTIRALSRVTELGGYVQQGHSRRVGDLAVAVGRELGLGEATLLDLEFAALLHDIGQLSFERPIPDGATIALDPLERRRVAELGAEVVRRAGRLEQVADFVGRQAEPYRRVGQHDDPTVPTAARVIKVANAYDDLVGDSPSRTRRQEALEHLRLSMSYEYDPRVVEALVRALERHPVAAGQAITRR